MIIETTAEIIMAMKDTKGVTETQIVTETETREMEGELNETKDKHTHMGVVEDNEGELGECLVARYKQQDSLLQE